MVKSVDDLVEEFERASKAIAKCSTMASGAVKSEVEYSAAYQRLVTVGVRQQLKAKYR